MYRGRIKRIHFVGIGGSGMNGIAEVLINMGYKVTGSDLVESNTTQRLRGLGALINIGHSGSNVHGADCVVYSSAVRMDNPEIKEARSLQIPIIPRAEMLAELMRMKYGIAIAGTHGKTTTTSMIASVLSTAGFDPTVVTGGKLNHIDANARLGGGEFLVAEADESDGTFLKLTPTIAVVTNIDREHMDHYRDMEDVKKAYLHFLNKVPFYGCAVVCLDHPVIQGLIPSIKRRYISYGLSAQADIYARNVEQKGMNTCFEVWMEGRCAGCVVIRMPGEHNVYNALASVAVARELGVEFARIKEGLEGFKGVERRFQVKGRERGILVIDDYGHHPVEIRATLRALKSAFGMRRAVVVFQPHRYTRTMDLLEEFTRSFNDADRLILTEIYPAGEERIEGISGYTLYRGVREHGHKDVVFVPEIMDIPRILEETTKEGDIVITLGAGNVWKVAEEFLGLLRNRKYSAGGMD